MAALRALPVRGPLVHTFGLAICGLANCIAGLHKACDKTVTQTKVKTLIQAESLSNDTILTSLLLDLKPNEPFAISKEVNIEDIVHQ
jgi:hypothetical protein